MDAKALKMMSRKDIQKLAQRENIKANLKSETIIQMLVRKYPEGVPPLLPSAPKKAVDPLACVESASVVGDAPGLATISASTSHASGLPSLSPFTFSMRSMMNVLDKSSKDTAGTDADAGVLAGPATTTVAPGSALSFVSTTTHKTEPKTQKCVEAETLASGNVRTSESDAGRGNPKGAGAYAKPNRPTNSGSTVEDRRLIEAGGREGVESTEQEASRPSQHLRDAAQRLLRDLTATSSASGRRRPSGPFSAAATPARAVQGPSFPGGRDILKSPATAGPSAAPSFPGRRNILEPTASAGPLTQADAPSGTTTEEGTSGVGRSPLRQVAFLGESESPIRSSSPASLPVRPTEQRMWQILRGLRDLVEEAPKLQQQLAEAQELLVVTEDLRDKNVAKLAAMRKERKVLERFFQTQLQRDERLHNGAHSWRPPVPAGGEGDHAYVAEVSDERSTDNFVESSSPSKPSDGPSTGEGSPEDEGESEIVASISRLKMDG
ncbi:hypothetical protein BDW22DRAFT_1479600 [Trametopsis cervina]|nr:hypothetical protein BDW22DRAFT_1479600 [Trametopsis cervina]